MRSIRIPTVTFAITFAAIACSSSPGDTNDATAPQNGSGDASGGDGAGMRDAAALEASPGAGPDAATVGPGSDLCAKATVIPLGARRSELHADTTAATHDVDMPCAPDSGADVFYQFTLSHRVLVYADTFGATWNTALFLLSGDCAPLTTSTMTGDAVCSDESCGTPQSRLVALLSPGNYKLGLGGSGTGLATIHFEIVLAASGTETPLPQGESKQSGTTQGETGNVQEDGCLAAGPENGYWWTTCPADPGGPLVASTCGGATWETLLSADIPRAPATMCSVGTCNLQTELKTTVPAGAGVHHLLVDGQAANARGAYVMQVTRP